MIFNKKVGNIRRNILLQVKSKQIELEKELDAARMALGGCSYIDNAPQWSILLDDVINLAVKLSDVNKELTQLEHCHVTINHGVLPY